VPCDRSPADRPSEALEDYFEEQRFAGSFERDGLSMTFESIDRPLAKAAKRPYLLHIRCALQSAD